MHGWCFLRSRVIRLDGGTSPHAQDSPPRPTREPVDRDLAMGPHAPLATPMSPKRPSACDPVLLATKLARERGHGPGGASRRRDPGREKGESGVCVHGF